MNKKADLRNIIVPIIVAVVVLAVIYFFLFTGTGRDILGITDTVTGGFDQSHEDIKDRERFRYTTNDPSEKIEFYDGTDWIEFTAIILNERTYESKDIFNMFSEYHTTSKYREEKSEILSAGIESSKISDALGIEQSAFCIKTGNLIYSLNPPSEKIRVYLVEGTFVGEERVCKEDILGTFTIDENNEVELLTTDSNVQSEWPNTYSAVLEMANNWKNSNLKKPIGIPYKQNDEEKIAYACVTKENNIYLQTILEDKVVEQNHQCPT